jgi:hypothetical protein
VVGVEWTLGSTAWSGAWLLATLKLEHGRVHARNVGNPREGKDCLSEEERCEERLHVDEVEMKSLLLMGERRRCERAGGTYYLCFQADFVVLHDLHLVPSQSNSPSPEGTVNHLYLLTMLAMCAEYTTPPDFLITLARPPVDLIGMNRVGIEPPKLY